MMLQPRSHSCSRHSFIVVPDTGRAPAPGVRPVEFVFRFKAAGRKPGVAWLLMVEIIMTAVDIVFRLRVTPTERQMQALDLLREVYGVRKISLKEKEQTIRIEYDISRLMPADIAALVHGAGIEAQVE